MLVGIVSDSHHNLKALDTMVARHTDVAMWIHGGDNIDDGEYLATITQVPVQAVIGNTDWPHEGHGELVFDLWDYKVFLTHGDRYGVNYGLDRIVARAQELDCNMVVFGHTHVGLWEQRENIEIINPGSISRPRDGLMPSYMVAEINPHGPLKVTRYFLD